MIGAAKKESSLLPGLAALRLVLLLVVALCLPETRVWGFAAMPQPASSVFESASPSSIGEFTTATAYDASGSPVAAKTPLTNGQLVQQVATRAEAWGARQGLPAAGGGSVQGTLKHDYAARLLDRYQSMYGSRGLQTEVSFLNGGAVNYGTRGSVRLDVFEAATGTAWDYKFTLNPALSSSRVQRIINNAPVNTVIPVGP